MYQTITEAPDSRSFGVKTFRKRQSSLSFGGHEHPEIVVWAQIGA